MENLISMTFWTVYLTLAFAWTFYMVFRTYAPNSMRGLRARELTAPYRANRPYFVGFLMTNFVLFPMALFLSATGGVLRNDLRRMMGKEELV